MLILPNQKLLYCHIHKNAGKSVRQMLIRIANGLSSDDNKPSSYNKIWHDTPIHGHASFKQVLHDHSDLQEYTKVAVIRNPYDRLASAYHWFKKKPPESQGINRTTVEHINSFEDYVEKLYDTYLSFSENEVRKKDLLTLKIFH